MTITLEAEVKSGSPIIGKTVSQINEEYNVYIRSTLRKLDSKIERLNPPKTRVIKENDIIEFGGDPDSVINLLKICESN